MTTEQKIVRDRLVCLRRKQEVGWVCLECGRKFRSAEAAERASLLGCPNCNSSDIDLNTGDIQ
jgi:DNA-directed RNA polymerase subunit RPC12/RpoP